jgi:hypothetical protein
MKKLLVILLMTTSKIGYSQSWKGLVDSSYINISFMVNDSANDKLIIGGYFVNIGTITNINGIATYDGISITEVSPNGDPNLNASRCALYYKGDLYVGGSFGFPYILKYDGSNWVTIGANNSVLGMSVINNELYVVGAFDSIAGIPARFIAKYDGITWQALNFDYVSGGQIINCIQSLNGELYIGGTIDQVGTGLRVTLLKYNSQTLHWEECVPLFNNLMINISNMYVYKNELYLAGTPPLGGTGPVILRYDGDSLKSVGGGLIGINPRINSFCEWDDKLVCAGFFNKAGIIDADGLAFWDGVNWCTIPSSNGDEVFSCVGVYQDTLYIAGTFAQMEGDSTVKRFAKWLGGKNYSICTTTDLEEIDNTENFKVFPNPANDQINIMLTSNLNESVEISVFDCRGNLVLNHQVQINMGKNNFRLKINDLYAGLYFVRINSNQTQVNKRFIKQ